MKQAVLIESKKLIRSRVGMVASILLSIGVGSICALLMLGIRANNPDIIAQAGADAAFDWQTLLGMATQITATAGLLGFGVVLAWHFAREFSDRTIYGMFSLPVSRGKIAIAKIIAFLLWCVVMSIALPVIIGFVGLLVGLPSSIAPPVIEAFGRLCLLLLMTGVIALPVGIVAAKTRSLLGGVGAAICLVVLASVMVLTGVAGWFTPSAPALWAMNYAQSVSSLQLWLVLPYGVISVVLLVALWKYMELD